MVEKVYDDLLKEINKRTEENMKFVQKILKTNEFVNPLNQT